MVGRTDISRRCCGCTLLDNAASAAVCSGSWSSPSTGKYRPAGGPAIRLYNSTAAGSRPWIASVTFDAVAASSPASVGVRLIGGAADCNNYCFVEWRVVAGGSNSVQIRLGQVVAGVETILAESPRTLGASLGTCAAYEEGLTWSGTKSRDMFLCWDGASLIGGWTLPPFQTGYAQTVQSNAATPAGGRAGYGVDAYSSIATLDFYDFALSRSHSDATPSCEACATHCCKGPVPDTLLFELSTPSESLDVSSWVIVGGSSRCYFDVSLFAGTWALAKGCPGDGNSCAWGNLIDEEYYIDCGCVGLGDCSPILFQYSLAASIVEVLGVRYLRVDARLTSFGNMVFPPQTGHVIGSWLFPTDAACEDWPTEEWLDDPTMITTYGVFSSSVAKIKRAA